MGNNRNIKNKNETKKKILLHKSAGETSSQFNAGLQVLKTCILAQRLSLNIINLQQAENRQPGFHLGDS